MSPGTKTVLWWGRFDPDYSRNRILRALLPGLGWRIVDFHPALSGMAGLEAWLRRLPRPDLVWVPCFRQRDYAAARRWSRARGVPLLFDPLISAYDKQVLERGKFPERSTKAIRLLHREQALFQGADIVLADTSEHARFFVETLGVKPSRLHVVYVGAEQPLFSPGTPRVPDNTLDVLFYGSFIPLQGPQVIIEAARVYQGPPVRWVLLGNGPLLDECKKKAEGLPNVVFENWLPYTELPERIRRADILLGVFGATPKAQRVIPNKVYQTLACGKPLITCRTPSYPDDLIGSGNSGIIWVSAADPVALADAIAALSSQPRQLDAIGTAARTSYERLFSTDVIRQQLRSALTTLF